MASISTEEFPYTIGYVKQLLSVEEGELMTMVKSLSLIPRQDKHSGSLIFSHQDTEVLRKAFDMNRRGESLDKIVRYFGITQGADKVVDNLTAGDSLPSVNGYASRPHLSSGMASGAASGMMNGSAMYSGVSRMNSTGQDNLSVVVEAVVSAKEGILKDMSRLLDDKLTGLDEVVVELIRCKSENDSLKKKIADLNEHNESLQMELSSFKSAGFGFFRKL